MSVINWS